MEDTRLAFERAADGAEDGEQALRAMVHEYARLISTRPEMLLMQMRGYAVVAAAKAEGDDQMGELLRVGWMRLWETVHLSPEADAQGTTSFFACGMLGTLLWPSALSPTIGKQGRETRGRCSGCRRRTSTWKSVRSPSPHGDGSVSACLPHRAARPLWAR
ncbi:hypothetical protein [Streptomyces sp. DSM 40750]|uniref:hypothetical protein n=1 Tax=Streptomyces sp. DSM 40750 TaxID=2801030 RepID=UPI00214BDF24|nr:hypothetical protein [Streptomyces sp. DSM 40750]UUU19597.1 hypothetical protein JIX55_04320 [Streptomyces sp. DSM 40750]UUU27059.1 hypothetical protein JIX55_46435 [Streptomyces sp. DSM 40750]